MRVKYLVSNTLGGIVFILRKYRNTISNPEIVKNIIYELI